MLNRIAQLRRNRSGFTLIELLVVVAIIALLATLALPRVFEAINTSKRDATKGELATISGALARYYLEKGEYPHVLSELGTAGFLKSGTTYKNKFNQNYLYAVNNSDKPTAFVLVDPGNSPSSGTTLCNQTTQVGKAPAGLDPTGTVILSWKGNTAPTGFTVQALTLQSDASCSVALTGNGIPDSLDSWTSVRKDLFTE